MLQERARLKTMIQWKSRQLLRARRKLAKACGDVKRVARLYEQYMQLLSDLECDTFLKCTRCRFPPAPA